MNFAINSIIYNINIYLLLIIKYKYDIDLLMIIKKENIKYFLFII